MDKLKLVLNTIGVIISVLIKILVPLAGVGSLLLALHHFDRLEYQAATMFTLNAVLMFGIFGSELIYGQLKTIIHFQKLLIHICMQDAAEQKAREQVK